MESAGTVQIFDSNLRRASPPMLVMAALLSPLALCITGGCANDQQRTRTEGVGLGALVGTAVGAAIGGRDGAAVGAVAGGLVGGVYGDQQAKKKQQFAEREDALRLAVSQAQETTRQAREANGSMQREIAKLRDSINRLQAQRMDANRRAQLARSTKQQLEQANARVDQQLVAVRSEIGRQQQALKHDLELARSAPEAAPPSLRLVKAGVDDLRSQERALEQAKAQLAQIDPSRAY